MNRVKAEERYYFNHSYFEKFLSENCFDKILLLAKISDKIITGALCTITGKVMQYNLAGSRENYRKQPAMKIIIDEARKLAI